MIEEGKDIRRQLGVAHLAGLLWQPWTLEGCDRRTDLLVALRTAIVALDGLIEAEKEAQMMREWTAQYGG